MTLVSENIRYLRKLNGLTQEQFSRKINIKRSLLGAYEEARANPNQQNIQAIAKAFNTTVELLTRQDLRKLRETPNLSIPLGQSSKGVDGRSRADREGGIGSASPVRAIRSDGKLEPTDDDPFQHPDFPDIFAQPEPAMPEPQPLASVLNKYYKTADEPPTRERLDRFMSDRVAPDRSVASRPAPVPPVITPPVRPANERAAPTGFQPVSLDQSPVDRLFGELRPAQSPPPSTPVRSDLERSGLDRPGQERPGQDRPTGPMTFNNVYAGPGAPTPSLPAAQAVAPTIPVVMQSQFGEYVQRHQQAEFMHRLPVMHLPNLPDGQYRAFEAGDEFQFPGALLVGQFVRNWFDIADGKTYVLLLHNAGLCCRRVYNQVKVKGTLLLTADRVDIPNREVALKEVLEVWEVCAFVSQQLPPPTPSTDRLKQLVEELRFEVGRL